MADAFASLAVIGAVGQWPGGCDNDMSRAWLKRACGDAFGAVPATRWMLAVEVDLSMFTPEVLSSVQHGGFIKGAERFDAAAFGISSAEATVMDPQQRLLLEQSYTALHTSAHRRATLMGGDTGVFLGIERPDWAIVQPPPARLSVYAVTGDNISAAAGRV
eukprot:7383118-Prymnesium_polylepis.1